MNTLAGFQGYGIIMTVVIGALAGWIAEKLTRSDMGLVMNLIYGIVGGIVGNFIFGLLNLHVSGGFIMTLLSAVLGAVLLIVVIKMVRNRGRTV